MAATVAVVVAFSASAAATPTAPSQASVAGPVKAGGQRLRPYSYGLITPTAFAAGAGQVFAADGGRLTASTPNLIGGVFVLRHGRARRLPGSPTFVAGLAWRAGTLYLSNIDRLLAWSGWNGVRFTRQRVLYRAPAGFPGFNGLGFGPDGRLYVGVDVDLGGRNDHGPPRAPFQYDILSLDPSGGSPRIFARGIRQPWQLAFPAGSAEPFVSVLGQDGAARNPPDFVLRVRAGQNYGFPTCNWTAPARCARNPRPVRFFAPHVDPMGLAILGGRLYISEYVPRRVVSMALSGRGPLRQVARGFTANVVGLAAIGGWLYAGDEGGRIYRFRP